MAGLYCNIHKVYRDLRGGGGGGGGGVAGQLGCLATRPARPRYDAGAGPMTRLWGPRHGRLRAATWRLATTIRPCVCPLGRACEHLGAGPTSCALSAPSLFLDLVLFMSHCLDSVHEHCSSQKIFAKKKKKLKF